MLSDSMTGPILGSTDPVAIPPRGLDPTTFFFSIPVPVMPGQTYYFQVVEQAGDDTWGGILADPDYRYPGGTAFFNGVPNAGWDLWFREGIVVPEPSSALIFIVGIGAFALARRVKAKARP